VGGLRAGLLATGLTYFAASYYLLPPLHSFAIASAVDRWQQFFVMLAGVLISTLNEGLHRARRRASNAIRKHREVEQERERFFALSQDMLCVLGFDGYFKDVNRAWEQTLGYTKAELLATPFIEFVHPADRGATLTEAEKVSGGRGLTAFENRYRCKDGSHRCFQWNVTPVIENGVMYGVARDVTEGKRAEEALRERETQLHASDRRLAEIVHGMTEACFTLDAQWRFTFVNDRCETQFHRTREAVLGRSIWELFPQLLGTPMEAHYRHAMAERVPVSVEAFSPVAKRWLDIRLFPTRDGIAAFLLDVHSRKLGEEALRESEQRLRFTLESCNIGAWDLDLVDHTAYRSVEHDRIFGYPEMLPQWTLEDFLRHALPEYRAQVEAIVGEATTALRGWTFECPIRRVDGEIRWIWFSGNYRTDSTGHGRVGGVVMDITDRKQAEEAQRASEARYRTLFECAPDGIVIADPAGIYLEANGSICQMLGYTREEMIGLPSSSIVAEAESPHIGPALSAINTETPYHREWQFRRKDHSLFAAEVIATKMPDGNLLAMIHDITERKRVEARMRRLVNSNAQGVIFWNRQGEILRANDAFLHMVGYTRGDLEAGRVGWAAMTPPGYADLDRHSLEELAATGVCTPFEKEYFRKDGSRVPVTIGAANFEDNPDEGVCFVLDITQRKLTEQAIRASEEHFRFLNDLSEATRTLSDPAQIMIVMARLLGKHLRASRCAYADVAQGGEQFTILHDYTDGCASTVGNYHLSLFGARAMSTLQGGQTLIIRDVEAELLPDEGADMFNAIGIKAIVTCPLVKEGRLRAMMAVHQTTPREWKPGEIAIVQDVVERCWATIVRRTAEEKIHELNNELEQRVIERTAQLEAANKELEAFSYSVSHDLRAPLRAISGFAGILLEDFGTQFPPEAVRYLTRIRQGGQQMGELIDDLLAFSQLSRQPVNRLAVDVVELTQTILDEMKPQLNGRSLEIRVGKLPACHGDPALLKQVWVNLISNAVKYTRGREPAIIEIGCTFENQEQVYWVRDNGAGFDMQYANKLFGVFQRLHRGDEFEGTGVGLAIVQRIVHRHGGRIWARAIVGQGATFYFTIQGETKHE
jgi:PAS domain S-box-containing protein